jgi:hypothetical protein
MVLAHVFGVFYALITLAFGDIRQGRSGESGNRYDTSADNEQAQDYRALDNIFYRFGQHVRFLVRLLMLLGINVSGVFSVSKHTTNVHIIN